MTSADLFAWLIEASLALAVSGAVVLAVRRVARRHVSARYLYAVWLAVPAALVATLAPNGVLGLGGGVDLSGLSIAAGTPLEPFGGGARGEGAAPPAATLSPAAVAVFAWLAVAAMLAALQARAQRRFHRDVVAEARRPDAAEARALGDAPHVPGGYRFSARIDGPVACGLLRPAVLLPDDVLRRYSDAERRAMILHEAEHVRAGHLAHRAAAAALRCLFWFHPAAWIAERALAADQELACDEAVLGRRGAPGPKLYAETLLKAAECAAGGGTRSPALGASLITVHHMKERTAMLNHHASLKNTRGRGLMIVGAAAAASILAGLSAVAAPGGERQFAQADAAEQGDGWRDRIIAAIPPVRTPAVYPPRAMQDGVEGNCVVLYDIQTDGSVDNVKSQSCTDPVFEKSSIEMAQKLRYEPADVRDAPAEARREVPLMVAFDLTD